MEMTKEELIKEIRMALEDLVNSSGCGCCCDLGEYYKAEERLSFLLGTPKPGVFWEKEK